MTAASTNFSYSPLVSSLPLLLKKDLCRRIAFRCSSCQHINLKYVLTAASIELTVDGARPLCRSSSFQTRVSSFVTGYPASHPENILTSRRYFSIVPGLRSSSRRNFSNRIRLSLVTVRSLFICNTSCKTCSFPAILIKQRVRPRKQKRTAALTIKVKATVLCTIPYLSCALTNSSASARSSSANTLIPAFRRYSTASP